MLVDVKDKFASLKIVKLLKDKIDVLEKWNDKGRLEGSEKGTNSIAFGYETTASGEYSYANGWKNAASGDYSRAEGLNTTASGYNSHSEGRDTIASGDTAHAEGSGTIASCNNQHAEGSYNIEDTEGKYLHIVGNGTSDTYRSNAHTLDGQGNAWYAGDISNGTGSLNGVLNSTGINLYPENGELALAMGGEHFVDINLLPDTYTCSCETSSIGSTYISFQFFDSEDCEVGEECILDSDNSYIYTVDLSERGASKVKISVSAETTLSKIQIEQGGTKHAYESYIKSVSLIYNEINSIKTNVENKVNKCVLNTSDTYYHNLLVTLDNDFKNCSVGDMFEGKYIGGDGAIGFWKGVKFSDTYGLVLIISDTYGIMYAVRDSSVTGLTYKAWTTSNTKYLYL